MFVSSLGPDHHCLAQNFAQMTYFFMFMQLLLNLHFRTSQILILHVRARALLLVYLRPVLIVLHPRGQVCR
jgi:hypothetical protein